MAIRFSDTFTAAEGEQRADALIAAAPARSWQRLSVGAGHTAHGSSAGRGSPSGLGRVWAAGTG